MYNLPRLGYGFPLEVVRVKVALYARISEANDRLGVERQVRIGRARAEAEGWTVVGPFVDNSKSAYTGSKPRPGYEAMLAAVAQHEVAAVWVVEKERLHRSRTELTRIADVFEAGSVRWLRVGSLGEEADIRLGTAAGDRALRDAGSAAIYESQLKSERVTRKIRELAENRHWLGGGRPFGYDIVECQLDHECGAKTLAIRENEANALRRATGWLLDGQSLRSVARRLNADGLTTVRGAELTGGTLRKTLLAPRNVGDHVHGDTVRRGAWPPVLDRPTWKRVVTLLRDEERATLRSETRYLLTGIATCAEHGTPMVGRPVNHKRTYLCTRGPEGRRVHLGVTARHLEEYVIAEADHHDATATVVRDPAELSAPLLAELERLEEQLGNWAREAATAGLSAAEIRAGREPLVAQQRELEGQLERVEATVTGLRPWLREWLEAGAPDPNIEMRAHLETLVERIVVHPRATGGNRANVPARVQVVWR